MAKAREKACFSYRVGLVRMDPSPFFIAGAVCLVQKGNVLARAFTGTQDNLPSALLASLMEVESMLPGCTAGEVDVAPGEFSVRESYVAILDETGSPWALFGTDDDAQAQQDARTVLSHPQWASTVEILRTRVWVNGTGERPWAAMCRELVSQA